MIESTVLATLAPRSVRLLAVMVDSAITFTLLTLATLGLAAGGLGLFAFLAGARVGLLAGLGGGVGIVVGILSALLLLAFVIYNWFLLFTRGQTFGKRLFGIQIVDLNTGDRAGGVTALVVRSLLPALFISVLYRVLDSTVPWLPMLLALASVMPIFLGERRCLHDYFAGTQVRWVDRESGRRFAIVAATALALLVGGALASTASGHGTMVIAAVKQLLQRPAAVPIAPAVATAPEEPRRLAPAHE